jgi:hypothetical protein
VNLKKSECKGHLLRAEWMITCSQIEFECWREKFVSYGRSSEPEAPLALLPSRSAAKSLHGAD